MTLTRFPSLLSLAVGAVLLLGACAGQQATVDVSTGSGREQTVAMEASSFSFQPNHVVARVGSELVLEVENTSGSTHNLTVTAPDGSILAGADLPAGETVALRVLVAKAGEYRFHCDKPLHPTFGMKGSIEAR